MRPEDGEECEGYLLKVPLRSRLFLGGGDPLLRVSTAMARTLSNLVTYLLEDLRSGAPLLHRGKPLLLAETLLEEHLRFALGEFARDTDVRVASSRTSLRQAEDFVHEHFGEPIRLADVSEAAGLGVRELQAAYRKTTGQTPLTRLTFIRLKQARTRLLLAEGEQYP